MLNRPGVGRGNPTAGSGAEVGLAESTFWDLPRHS